MAYFDYLTQSSFYRASDQDENNSAPGSRRDSIRRKYLLRGFILVPNTQMVLTVTVRNLSMYGAGLLAEAVQPLPHQSIFIVPKQDLAYDFEIRWRNLPGFGVQFSEPIDKSMRPEVGEMIRAFRTA